jgi:hypothetical protein
MPADSTSTFRASLLPLTVLNFKMPAAGLPPLQDWITVAISMLTKGVEFRREGLDILFPTSRDNTKLSVGAANLVKGFTRASCLAFIIIVASELNVASSKDLLLPLAAVLDFGWMIPCNVSPLNISVSQVFETVELTSDSKVHTKHERTAYT